MARELSVIETLDMTPAKPKTKKVTTMANTNEKFKAAKTELKEAKATLRDETKNLKEGFKSFLGGSTEKEVVQEFRTDMSAYTKAVKAVAKAEAKIEKLTPSDSE